MKVELNEENKGPGPGPRQVCRFIIPHDEAVKWLMEGMGSLPAELEKVCREASENPPGDDSEDIKFSLSLEDDQKGGVNLVMAMENKL